VRWDRFDPDRHVGGDRQDIVTPGFNIFFAETTKLQLNYQAKFEERGHHVKNDVFQAQIQYGFKFRSILNMKKLFTYVSYALLLGLTTFSQQSFAINKPTIINFGVANAGIGGRPNIGDSPISVVNAKKLIEEELKGEGIEVRWHYFLTAGPGVNEALTNDLLDFAWQGDLPNIIGKANGLKTKLILPAGRRYNNYIAATEGSGITNIESLRGKKVAIFKGTCTQLVGARLLAAHGLKESDLNIYNMNSPSSIAALASKDIDASLSGVDLFAISDRGLAKIIYNSKEEDNSKYGCALSYVVTEKFSQQYPEVTQKVVNAIIKAVHFSSEESNRAELLKIWQQSGTPSRHFAQNWDKVSLKERFNPLFDDYFAEHYKQAIADSQRFGLLTQTVDINQWFDSKYLEAALKELKLENYWTPENKEGKPGGKALSIHPGK
jgi:sulfonate transport system substrate-binding protein